MKKALEESYPITFRQDEAKLLAKYLNQRTSVSLVGMKRVGINNFLRFFLYHQEIFATYFNGEKHHIFVRIDLNDLVQRSLYPFWTLVLKRIIDAVATSTAAPEIKKQCIKAFSDSIQLKDLFFTVDSIQKVLSLLVQHDLLPTLFFLRFDRLKETMGLEFFNNLQGIIEASKHKAAFVFTSFRPLHELVPDAITKSSLGAFSHTLYIKPAQKEDSGSMLKSMEERYHVTITKPIIDTLYELSGGHAQYLQLALIKMQELKKIPESHDALFDLLSYDEQVTLQSEELYASLNSDEKEVIQRLVTGKPIDETVHKHAHYLWDVGMVTDDKHPTIFSPLFANYAKTVTNGKTNGAEFTRKEHLLFTYLKEHEGTLCERDAIIHAVWPEQEEMGVSDWAIDRLVSRVRNKLKSQHSPYEIVTVITRGYKLVSKG